MVAFFLCHPLAVRTQIIWSIFQDHCHDQSVQSDSCCHTEDKTHHFSSPPFGVLRLLSILRNRCKKNFIDSCVQGLSNPQKCFTGGIFLYRTLKSRNRLSAHPAFYGEFFLSHVFPLPVFVQFVSHFFTPFRVTYYTHIIQPISSLVKRFCEIYFTFLLTPIVICCILCYTRRVN